MVKCHPNVDGLKDCKIHAIVDGQCHLILEVNNCHPNVDGRCHPFLDVY